jgi:hypothetical protein
VTHTNNIAGIMIRNVSSNGSVNFGHDIFKGLAANSESVGGQTVIGDGFLRPANNVNDNIVSDPDGVDQGQFQI